MPEQPVALCIKCGEYLQSTRKGVARGQCCNKCPNHGVWCTSKEASLALETESTKQHVSKESKSEQKKVTKAAQCSSTAPKCKDATTKASKASTSKPAVSTSAPNLSVPPDPPPKRQRTTATASSSKAGEEKNNPKEPMMLPKTGALLVGMPDGSVRAYSTASLATRPNSSAQWKTGMRVEAVDLVKHPRMNGKQGKLAAFDIADRRWEVHFDNGVVCKLRESHISPVADDSMKQPKKSQSTRASLATEGTAPLRPVRRGLLQLEAYLDGKGAVRPGCAAAVVALMDHYIDIERRIQILHAIQLSAQLEQFVKIGCVKHVVSWMELHFAGGGLVSEELLLKCFDVLELLPPLLVEDKTTQRRLGNVCLELQSRYPDLAAQELVRKWFRHDSKVGFAKSSKDGVQTSSDDKAVQNPSGPNSSMSSSTPVANSASSKNIATPSKASPAITTAPKTLNIAKDENVTPAIQKNTSLAPSQSMTRGQPQSISAKASTKVVSVSEHDNDAIQSEPMHKQARVHGSIHTLRNEAGATSMPKADPTASTMHSSLRKRAQTHRNVDRLLNAEESDVLTAPIHPLPKVPPPPSRWTSRRNLKLAVDLTDLDERVNQYIVYNKIEENAAKALRAAPCYIQAHVLSEGPLKIFHNPSAVVISRIKRAGSSSTPSSSSTDRGLADPPRDEAAKTDTLISELESINHDLQKRDMCADSRLEHPGEVRMSSLRSREEMRVRLLLMKKQVDEHELRLRLKKQVQQPLPSAEASTSCQEVTPRISSKPGDQDSKHTINLLPSVESWTSCQEVAPKMLSFPSSQHEVSPLPSEQAWTSGLSPLEQDSKHAVSHALPSDGKDAIAAQRPKAPAFPPPPHLLRPEPIVPPWRQPLSWIRAQAMLKAEQEEDEPEFEIVEEEEEDDTSHLSNAYLQDSAAASQEAPPFDLIKLHPEMKMEATQPYELKPHRAMKCEATEVIAKRQALGLVDDVGREAGSETLPKRLSSLFLEQIAALEVATAAALKSAHVRPKDETLQDEENTGPEKTGPLPWIRAAISAFEEKVANSSDEIWEFDPDTGVVDGDVGLIEEVQIPGDMEIVDTEDEASDDDAQKHSMLADTVDQVDVVHSPTFSPESDLEDEELLAKEVRHDVVPTPASNPAEPSPKRRPMDHPMDDPSPRRLPVELGISGGSGESASLTQVLDDLLAARSVFEAEGAVAAVAEIDRQVSRMTNAGGALSS